MKNVSVIIPTYQHASTLDACLKSLLGQTVLPKEIIVVDDGSTDQTNVVLEPFFDQIIYEYQSNQGAPIARNHGASLATGELLLFCDADVIASPLLIERLRDALEEQPEASYAYCAFRWGSRLFRAKPFDGEALRRQNFIHTTSLIRRQAFVGFDPSLKRFQDWDLWLTMLEQGHVGVAVEEELFRVVNVKGRVAISRWVPALLYRFPWKWIGWKPSVLRAYDDARSIIVNKHHLV